MKPTKKTAKSLQSKNSDPRLSSSASTRSGSESEKVQQTLINSELRYRRLFETARDGILILDAETGTITDVNPYIAKMLGYSREEFIEKKLWEVGAFRNIKASNDGFEELQEKEYIRYDNIPLKTKDGRLVQVEFVSNVYVVGGKKVIQCNIRDITERRQAEEERILLRTIIDYIPVAVYAKDRDGRKVLANSFDLAHFNKPESEIIGHTDMELFPKEVAERTMADDLLVIRDGERIIDREELIINDAGESRWLLTSKIPWRNMEGKIIGLVGIGHDITGRKLAEEKSRKLWTSVQEEKDRLSALLNSINDEVWFADTRKKFILANLSARHEFDIKYQGEIDVETFASRLEVYHLDGSPRPIEEAAPLKALKGETVKNQEEIIRTPATGELRYRQVSASPVRVSSGNIIGSVSVVRDITESKRAEEEIKKLNAELEAFSYSVSHDLRSPLRAIDGFSRILSEEYHAILDDEGKRLLTVVRSNTKRMAQLIDDLLAFSRMGRKEMVCGEINMERLVQSMIEELKQSAGERTIEVTVGLLPPAFGDIAMIRQVFANFLSNAFKFTLNTDRAVVQIKGSVENGENIYSISDNGVGFDMEYKNKLFGVFQRLHSQEEFEGTGVGLAIVQRIIHRHGGRVWGEGVVNGGACFSFALPVKSFEEKE